MKNQSRAKKDKREIWNSLSKQAKRNFGLSEEEFESMLYKMKMGDELLFEQVFLSQFEESMKYLMHQYSINRSDAYDVTMDALLRFRKRLLAGKISYGNMRFLFTRMAGQFLSESVKRRMVMVDDTQNDKVEDENVQDEILDMLDKAWTKLCEDCSNLLRNFYYQKISLKTLSNQLNKTEAATRKQKQRCLNKLRLYFLEFYNS